MDTRVSKEARKHPHWEPDWISGFFTTSATCANNNCHETAVLLGEMKVDVNSGRHRRWDGEDNDPFVTFLRLLYVEPPLALMRIPERCPAAVREAIIAASRVIWSDPSSAGNRLRTAVEELLTAMRVRKTTNGRTPMSTHARIESLRSRKPEVADTLEAVKWIGNSASHAQILSAQDVLEAAALLDRALRQVYDTSDKQLARLAKEINKRRGRPSRAQ